MADEQSTSRGREHAADRRRQGRKRLPRVAKKTVAQFVSEIEPND